MEGFLLRMTKCYPQLTVCRDGNSQGDFVSSGIEVAGGESSIDRLSLLR